MQTGKKREGRKEGRKKRWRGGERERERSGYVAIISKMKLIKRDTVD